MIDRSPAANRSPGPDNGQADSCHPRRTWLLLPIALVVGAWLLSGFYIVRGDQQAVVRRFGKLLRTDSGVVEVSSSGLRWDLPWPLARIDRVNTHQARTLTVGLPEFGPELSDDAAADFLQNVDPSHQSQFLTGDRNILNLQITVHYHVGDIERFLFQDSDPHGRLGSLVESLVSDAVCRSGVDFVYVHGRNRLRQILVHRLTSNHSTNQLGRFGLVVDDVTVGAVYPPIQAKPEFLEVMNARAQRQTHINNARAYQVQRANESRAEANRVTLEADSYRSRTVAAAQGQAARFDQLVTQIQDEARKGKHSYAETRELAMKRMYLDAIQDIFAMVKAKIVIDSGRPVDLTILKESAK